MPAPTNHLKAKLAAGERQVGCWLGLASPLAAEVAMTAGFDWLLIDAEHAPNDLSAISAQLGVLTAGGAQAIVRLPWGETWQIKQVLDAGAQTLLIPLVESGAEAERMARAMRYPPEGNRGAGAALARASRYSAIPDYLQTANDQMCLLVQVETVKGIEALDDILAVEGIDGIFIGPADLSADMGFLGQSSAPEVMKVMEDAIRRARAAGKAAGIMALDPRIVEAAEGWGANFLAVGIDVTSLGGALRDLAKRAKGG